MLSVVYPSMIVPFDRRISYPLANSIGACLIISDVRDNNSVKIDRLIQQKAALICGLYTHSLRSSREGYQDDRYPQSKRTDRKLFS